LYNKETKGNKMTSQQIEKMIAQMIQATIKMDLSDSDKMEALTDLLPSKMAETLGVQVELVKFWFWDVAKKIEGAI
jgi:hypothetical protein